ncbi:MAG: DJ-1/PfpI family protein [Oscillospiraceae bacterium]|nr:DJ-1/PfpI family protein [Oscillospiraceae bacterium]
MKEVLFVLLDEFAEWEAAPLAAAINQNEAFCVRTVSVSPAPVRSIGGFSVNPDYDIPQALAVDFAGLLLIGGNSWRKPEARQVTPLVRRTVEIQALLGAICDASVYLGRLGLLNGIAHTSNQPEDLERYAGSAYTGQSLYRYQQAVRCGNIVTANGTAGLEFAKEVLLGLGVMAEAEAEQWYRFYKLGYYAAMERGRA